MTVLTESSLTESWTGFKDVLSMYPTAYALLDPPCSDDDLHELAASIKCAVPEDLKALLTMNNGQRIEENAAKKRTLREWLCGGRSVKESVIDHSIFKSVSGWNVYRRHRFLSATEIVVAYNTFVSDEERKRIFGAEEIPFAVCGTPRFFEEAFCINGATGAVGLFWTSYADPFNPPDWQLANFPRGASLAEFIRMQSMMYR